MTTQFYFDQKANPVPAEETQIIERKETRYMGAEELPVTLVVSVRVDRQDAPVSDVDLDDEADQRFIAAYREASGKMTPDAIRSLRQRLGLSQRGLANLVGWSSATVERYERGSAPSAVNNKILNSLKEPDRVKNYFQTSNKGKFSKKDFISLSQKFLESQERAEFMTAKQVADWFLAENLKELAIDSENNDPMTQMKLHKLVYFSQVLYLGRKNQQLLFEEDTEAFQYGPVYESIRKGYSYSNQREIQLTESERQKILTRQRQIETNNDVLEVLNQIWHKLAIYTAGGLMNLTHRAGSSWEKNYNGTPFKIIPNTDLAEDFSLFTDLFGQA